MSLEAFAESLEEDEEAGLFDDADDADVIATWQEQLEMLLDPDTPAAKRQVRTNRRTQDNSNPTLYIEFIFACHVEGKCS